MDFNLECSRTVYHKFVSIKGNREVASVYNYYSSNIFERRLHDVDEVDF